MAVLDSTITAGTVIVSGIGGVTDNSGGTAYVDTSSLLSNTSVGAAVWADADGAFLLKIIKNKKALVKNGATWEMVIYDDDGSTPILNKALKDKDVLEISDLATGTLAIEQATSV
jgi:hypothetical protein